MRQTREAKFFDAPEFKKLDAEWKKKLADSGFEDAEQDDDNLKRWHDSFFKARHKPGLFEAKQEYYRLAGQFLNEYKFVDPIDKYIWERHSEGDSIVTIVRLFKDQGVKIPRNVVHLKLKAFTKEMLSQAKLKADHAAK